MPGDTALRTKPFLLALGCCVALTLTPTAGCNGKFASRVDTNTSVEAPEKTTPGVRKKASLPPTAREQWQMPVRVMDEIGVKPGMTVADVGAGEGWFTFYLADRVGPSGRVIAEDIDAQALEAVHGSWSSTGTP